MELITLERLPVKWSGRDKSPFKDTGHRKLPAEGECNPPPHSRSASEAAWSSIQTEPSPNDQPPEEPSSIKKTITTFFVPHLIATFSFVSLPSLANLFACLFQLRLSIFLMRTSQKDLLLGMSSRHHHLYQSPISILSCTLQLEGPRKQRFIISNLTKYFSWSDFKCEAFNSS